MKNSSRFEEKIAQNLTRSSSGSDSSSMSASTRALKSSHESSRFSSPPGASVAFATICIILASPRLRVGFGVVTLL